ncbi:MAG: hypothetical protein U0V70_03095 [Terriglobia bacterium]
MECPILAARSQEKLWVERTLHMTVEGGAPRRRGIGWWSPPAGRRRRLAEAVSAGRRRPPP